jgi:hypothetical protein
MPLAMHARGGITSEDPSRHLSVGAAGINHIMNDSPSIFLSLLSFILALFGYLLCKLTIMHLIKLRLYLPPGNVAAALLAHSVSIVHLHWRHSK